MSDAADDRRRAQRRGLFADALDAALTAALLYGFATQAFAVHDRVFLRAFVAMIAFEIFATNRRLRRLDGGPRGAR